MDKCQRRRSCLVGRWRQLNDQEFARDHYARLRRVIRPGPGRVQHANCGPRQIPLTPLPYRAVSQALSRSLQLLSVQDGLVMIVHGHALVIPASEQNTRHVCLFVCLFACPNKTLATLRRDDGIRHAGHSIVLVYLGQRSDTDVSKAIAEDSRST